MKFNVFASLAGAVASIAVIGTTLPAQAFSFSFGTSGIQFDEDTTVNFSFKESHGAYTSSVRIFEENNLSQAIANLFWETKQSDNGGKNEWEGTFGNAVTSSTGTNLVSFTFRKGIAYTLGLDSGRNGTVYSTSRLNSRSTQQAVFGETNTLWSALDRNTTANFRAANQYQSGNLFSNPVLVSFDDRGNKNDTDFQDFAIEAQAQPVPEPLSVAGIAIAGAGLSYARRRRQATQTV